MHRKQAPRLVLALVLALVVACLAGGAAAASAAAPQTASPSASRFVPMGTHGLVWRYNALSWNFVAQVEIDSEDEGETNWRVQHTHPDGIAPGRTGIDSRIVCRDGEDRACTMSGPAVTDLRAWCTRADHCELATDGRVLRAKVPATVTRGPLNWIVRDRDGNRLGRVSRLGRGYPNGAVALLAATTMLCPEAAAAYVGCPTPLAAPQGSSFVRKPQRRAGARRR